MARINYDDDTGEFYPEIPRDDVYDNASAWVDKEGRLIICTGDDGFGLRLNDTDLEQFIEFLRDVKQRSQREQDGQGT